MRRLTRDELLHSLTAVLGPEVMDAEPVREAAAQIPNETTGDLVSEFQDGHAFDHVEGLFLTAEAVATEVSSRPRLESRIFGGCAPTADRACAEQFLDGVGRRLLKRPIDRDRREAMLTAFEGEGGGRAGLRFLLARLLQSPEVVFHVAYPREACGDSECPEVRETSDAVAVDDWTVAARVAYALTGEGPDDALLEAAEREELRSEDAVREHAERLLATPAARRQLEAIFDSWLGLRELPHANAILASVAGIDADGLSEEARRELLDFVTYMVLDREAGVAELMTARIGFPRSERLARLYASERASTDPVDLPNGHRGVLLRLAPLLSGQLRSSPILRGVYVRKRLLCDDIPSPDFTIVEERQRELEASDPVHYSTRQIVTEITSPTVCASCHAEINPIGFSLEAFGPLGQPRDEEIVYDDTGEQLARHPIDTFVEDPRLEEGGPSSLEGPDDLVTALASGGKARACLAERLFSQAQLRPISDADTCLLAELEQGLRDGLSVKEAWIRAVVNPSLFLYVMEGTS